MVDQKQIRAKADPTFYLGAQAIAGANNKPMAGLLLAAGAVGTVQIWRIWLRNAQTATVTGILATFDLKRITGISGHTVIPPEILDTNDSLTNTTVFTGGTVAGEATNAVSRRWATTDELAASGNPVVATTYHTVQNSGPTWEFGAGNTKPLTLRAGQGAAVILRAASAPGTWDIEIEFTRTTS